MAAFDPKKHPLNVPIVQVSLYNNEDPDQHYRIGQALESLRDEGILIITPGKSPTDEDAWLWVRPQPGCLIVNLGDAMVQWTGGLLRSNVHRVYHAPGEQRFVDRYSLALLVRPGRDASMRRLMGGGAEDEDGEDSNLTACEWEVKKLMALVRG